MEPTIYKPSIYKGAGIYKTGAGGGGQPGDRPDLPAGFEILGAIYWNDTYNSMSSDGIQILPATNKGKIISKFYKPNTDDQNDYASLFLLGDWYSRYCDVSTNTYIKSVDVKNNSSTFSLTKKFGVGLHEIILQQNKCTIDGIEYTIPYIERNGITVCFPFPLNGGRMKPDPIFAMYEFKVIDDADKVIVDFVPVKRKLDNALGVFDVASGNFYTERYFSYYNI